MLRTESTPTRSRVIQGDAYDDDFAFVIPQPFTAEHVEGVSAVGASPHGVAQQLNQVLAENLGNNMASRIKKAVKANAPLPTQEDMDELYASYDFTGLRSSSVAIGSLFDRLFYKEAGSFLRKLFKKKGYQDMPAPVTVAKKTEEPGPQQISYDDFETEIARLMEGDGPWGENQLFIDVRNGMIEDIKAEEAAIRARESKAEGKLASLGL